MIRHTVRRLLSKLHLYIGLSCGLVFVLLGLTGSAIAWMPEIDALLNPELLQVDPGPGRDADEFSWNSPATAEAVLERLAADPAYGKPARLLFPEHWDGPIIATYRPARRAASPFGLDVSRQVMVNPGTLEVLGERNYGELGLSRPLLMPTVFHLHRYLLAGQWGKTATAIIGLILALCALTGAVLWLPRPTLKALQQSLSISYRGSWPRFNYSFHRAAGILAAPILLVLGLTGCYLNFPALVVPVVSSVLPVSPEGKVSNRPSLIGTVIGAAQAVSIAQQQFPAARVSRLALPATSSAPFEVRLRQPGEVRLGDGATRVFIDAHSGEVLRVRNPLDAPRGDALLDWAFPLHSGEAFGALGRTMIGAFGVMPLLFFVTGLTLWWRRQRRRWAEQRQARTSPVLAAPN